MGVKEIVMVTVMYCQVVVVEKRRAFLVRLKAAFILCHLKLSGPSAKQVGLLELLESIILPLGKSKCNQLCAFTSARQYIFNINGGA